MKSLLEKKIMFTFLPVILAGGIFCGLFFFAPYVRGQSSTYVPTSPTQALSGAYGVNLPPGGTVSGSGASLISAQSANGADNPGAQVAILLSLSQNIKLDTSLFTTNAIMLSLHDFSLTVFSEPVTRHDPFAPLGVDTTPRTALPVTSGTQSNADQGSNTFLVDQSSQNTTSGGAVNGGF